MMEVVQFARLRDRKSRNNTHEKLKSSEKGRNIPTRAAKQPVLRMARPPVDVASGTTSKSRLKAREGVETRTVWTKTKFPTTNQVTTM